MKNNNSLPDKLLKDYMIQKREEGTTWFEIASELGCTEKTVRSHAKRFGLLGLNNQPTGKSHRLTKEQLEGYLAQGMTYEEIAREVGCIVMTVYNNVKKFSLKPAEKKTSKRYFIDWLYEFSNESAGSKVKIKDVYANVLNIEMRSFTRIRKDKEVIAVMSELGIAFQGQSIVKVRAT